MNLMIIEVFDEKPDNPTSNSDSYWMFCMIPSTSEYAESIIEIIGEHNTVEKIALQNNMSIYEITTLLSPRINRIIKNKK